MRHPTPPSHHPIGPAAPHVRRPLSCRGARRRPSPDNPDPAPSRLPAPGPSFVREHEVRIGERRYLAGMGRPSEAPDGWWLAILWVADSDGVVAFRDVAPDSGPPADPPLARLGPSIAGALSGLILEDAGRLQLRVGAAIPPEDPDRPWRAPLVVRAAFRFEPARVATMRPNELADTVLAGFRQAVEGLHRP